MIYAIYNKKTYLANVRDMKVRLKTRIFEAGFKQLVDLGGNTHKDIFINEVEMDDVSMIYELDYLVLYKGNEYRCLKVDKTTLGMNYITIYINDSNVPQQYGFIKKEQFIFDKDVYLDEIDALIEIKKPILKFNQMKEEKIKIEQKNVRDYLTNIIE